MIFQWLIPLGFLGLIGIGVLIAIYIIRPKYTRRLLPSTFMWIRSQKYRRKRMPIEPFKDWLIFLLQALAIAACAAIIASPYLQTEETIKESNERIVVIDASESMRSKLVKTTGETRFKRAIDKTKQYVDEVLIRQGGSISVILADNMPEFIIENADRHSYSDVIKALDSAECSHGSADLEAAMQMAEDRVRHNPAAKVTVYSGTELGYMGDAVTFVNLSDPENEWNVGIYDCVASYEENQFTFYLDVAAYGRVAMDTVLHIEIKGVDNGEDVFDIAPLEIPVSFNVDENGDELIQHINITADPRNESIGGDPNNVVENFDEVLVQFRGLNDSLPDDDTLMVYGGKKDRVKIEYATSDRNIFFPSGIMPIINRYARIRDISLFTTIHEQSYRFEDYDFYFFEHTIPEDVIMNGLPDDGITVFLDPDEEGLESLDLGLKYEGKRTLGQFTYLKRGSPHPMTDRLAVENLGVSEYSRISVGENSGFIPIMYCGEDPVLYVRNWHNSKIVVMAFSVNQSNFTIKYRDFLFFICNMIDYYMPTTLTQYCYEIGQKAQVNCKGSSLTVQNMRGETVARLTEFPGEVPLDELGTYTFTTRFSIDKENEVRKAYVRTPVIESSIFRMEDLGFRIMNSEFTKNLGKDLFLWFAIAVVALLFVEYWLQHRDIVGR